MVSLKVNESVATVKAAPAKVDVNVILAIIGNAWKGNGLDAARTAAFEVGKLTAGGMLAYYKGDEFWKGGFKSRHVDEKWWSTVHESFQSGRSSLVTMNDLLEQWTPVPANDNDETPVTLTSDTALSDLTDPGGIVSDIVDWIVSSSSRPSRELALSATLPFVGALIGRRFASPSNLRTNFYTVALASSGYGKEHARTQLKSLVTAAGLARFTGPSRFMSATALRNSVMAYPSTFCMVDEFAGMMRQINDKKANIHSVLIRSDLLEMFSSAATFFEGAAYAKESPQKIHNPNLCIYGTSTPEDFWSSVSSLNTTDGLLARFLLVNVTGPKPASVEPSASVFDVPQSLIEAVQALASAGRGTGNLSNIDNGGAASKPTIVKYSPEAEAELARFATLIEEMVSTPDNAPILNRAVEHAIKLALTVSVATNWTTPIITGHAMKWAVKLAWLSTCTMIEETRDRISDNPREADLKRIFGHIKKAGKDGITEGVITDRCKSIDRKRREELLGDMVLSARIEVRETPTKGRAKKRYYLL